MQVLALGPVTVVDHGTNHDVEVPRHRAVLTALALRRRAPVPTSELIDAIWGDEPPASAEKTLQGYVSALRKRFGEDLIETVPGGYRLGDAVDAVDVDDFEALVTSGRRLMASGDLEGARGDLTRALALWRGRAAVDLAPGTFRDGHGARLEELRVLAQEGRAETELALGHHRDLVPELEQLVAEHPYREPLWRALMVAHYRAGSAGAALRTARRLRDVLRDDLGIDPSVESQALERRILDQDPSLELVDRPPGNLPVPLDSFVGRHVERQRITQLVREHRLVTVVGVGGVGKSRLANEVALEPTDEHPGGTWWVDLAAMPPTATVLGHVLSALGLPAQSTSPPPDVLLARLRRRPTLLVLDNCEHLRERVAAFVEWLTSNEPGVRILATSRLPLGVRGEQLVHLDPLPTNGVSSDGGKLFVARVTERDAAARIDPGDVVEIVRAVGGLPLGVELAAAQCGVRTTAEIARRLRERHALLALSEDDRRQRLGEVLDDTVDGLAPELAAALSQLAVFVGDFGLDAATAVLDVPADVAATMLRVFLDASLVTATSDHRGGRRFRLLWPIRELLLERSDPTTTSLSEARFAWHFRRVAGEFLDEADQPTEVAWLERQRVDDHNLRVALGWWEERDPLVALQFGPGLGQAWMRGGDQAEGRDTLQCLLTTAPDAPSRLIAATELALGFLELLSGDAAAALTLGGDAIARFEALDDPRWLARALRLQAHALHLGGFPADVTDPIYQRSLDVARDAHLTYSQALTEVHFAHASAAGEQHERAGRMLDHAETVLRRHDDHGSLAHAALGRAFIAFGRHDAVACRLAGEEMLRHARVAGDTIWIQIASVVLGLSWHELGDDERSRQFFRDAVQLAHDTANTAQLGIALHAVAATAAERHPEEAARLWGAAGSLTPIWPLHARRYGEWMESARRSLGDRFDDAVAAGARLPVDEAVELVDSLT